MWIVWRDEDGARKKWRGFLVSIQEEETVEREMKNVERNECELYIICSSGL